MSLYRFVIQQYDTLPPPVQEIVFALGWVVVSAGAVVLALIAATYLYPVLDRIWPMPEITIHPEVLQESPKRDPLLFLDQHTQERRVVGPFARSSRDSL